MINYELKIFKFIFFIFIIVSFLYLSKNSIAHSSVSSDPKQMVKYENSTLGISIEYPNDWQIHERYVSTLFPPSEGVVFFSPLESDNDKFSENFVIQITPLPTSPITLGEVVKLRMPTYNNPSVTIVDASYMDLLGNNAYKITYQIVNPMLYFGSMELMHTEILLIKDNKLYNMAYSALPEKFDSYKPMIDNMLDTLIIK